MPAYRSDEPNLPGEDLIGLGVPRRGVDPRVFARLQERWFQAIVRLTVGNRSELSVRLAARDDSFDVLRLAAATMVLVSHAFPLSGHHEPGLLGTTDTLGFIGVLVFFAISGFLVTRSWVSDPHVGRYASKRLLRIIPGLLVSLVLTAYALGPLMTQETVRAYFGSTGPLRYVLRNVVMLTDYGLPGVFHSNPSATVNGSLGTLPVEIKAYILLGLVGLILVSRSRSAKGVYGLAALVVLVVSLKTGVKPFWTLLELFCLFAGASALYVIRSHIRLRPELFVAAIAVWLISYRLPLGCHAVMMGASLPYAVLFLAFHGLGWLRPLTRFGDVSYGVYVYAFPVTQAVVYEGVRNAGLVILIALPVSWLLGLASWRIIERPCLRLKKRLARGPSEPGSEASAGISPTVQARSVAR